MRQQISGTTFIRCDSPDPLRICSDIQLLRADLRHENLRSGLQDTLRTDIWPLDIQESFAQSSGTKKALHLEKLSPCQEQGHIRYQLQAWNATSGERGSQLLVEQSILKHLQAVNFSANFKEQPVAVQTTWSNGCDFRTTENCEPPVESMGSNLFWMNPSGDL